MNISASGYYQQKIPGPLSEIINPFASSIIKNPNCSHGQLWWVCLCHRRYQIVRTYLQLSALHGLWANALAVVSFGCGSWTLAGVWSVRREGLSLKFLRAASCPISKECFIVWEHKVRLQTPVGTGWQACVLSIWSLCLPCVWSLWGCSIRILRERGLLGWHSMVFCADLETSLGEDFMHVKNRLCVKEAVRWSWFQGPWV